MDISNIKWSDIPQAGQVVIMESLDNALGITPSRVIDFYNESKSEHPEFQAAERESDVIGKFEHFWRTSRGWGGAVDAVWPSLRPIVEQVVTTTLALPGVIG